MPYKNPLTLSNELKEQLDSDPFKKTPTKAEEWDRPVDYWLNTLDPSLWEGENEEPFDFVDLLNSDVGSGIFDDWKEGASILEDHKPYIRKKVEELLNSKYDYLKPYYKGK